MNAATAFHSTFYGITQATDYIFSLGYSQRSDVSSGLKLPIDYFSTLATYVIGYPIGFLIAGIISGVVYIIDLFKSPVDLKDNSLTKNNNSIETPLETVALDDPLNVNDNPAIERELLNQNALKEKKSHLQNQIKKLDALIDSKITALNPICDAFKAQLERCGQLKANFNSNELTALYAKKIAHYETRIDSKISCPCGRGKTRICLYCRKELIRIKKLTSIPVYVTDLEQRQLACKNRPYLAHELELETKKLSTTKAQFEKNTRHIELLKNVEPKLSDLNYLVEKAMHADELSVLASTYEQLVKEVEGCDNFLKEDLIGKTSQQISGSNFFQPYSADKQEENNWLNYLDFGSG